MLALYPFVFLFAIVRTRPCPASAGEYFFFARYPAPAWPFLMLATAVGAHTLAQLAADLRPPLRLAARRATAILVLAALWCHPPALASAVERFGWNCQNMNEVQVAFGRWVDANVPPDRAVAINDAGAIRYFGNRSAVDLMGLNDRQVLFDPAFRRGFADADTAADYLLARRVDCAIVFRAWFHQLVNQPRFSARFAPVQMFASEHYTVADVRSGQTAMVAYRVLPRDAGANAAARPPR